MRAKGMQNRTKAVFAIVMKEKLGVNPGDRNEELYSGMLGKNAGAPLREVEVDWNSAHIREDRLMCHSDSLR